MRKMKNSGIEWIGEIPVGWEVVRMKSCIKQRDSGSWGEEITGENGDVVCLRIADFDYQTFKFKDTPIEELTFRHYSENVIEKLVLKKKDILIEKSGGGEKTPVGRTVIFDKTYQALFANFMDRLRISDFVIPEYMQYIFVTFYKNNYTRNYIKQTTGIQNLDLTSMLSSESVPLPALIEQQKIASFLDQKCAEIDAVIEKTKATIEEYKKLKQSVITEAVTKGIRGNRPMKDSGIEWIGEIPVEWDICKTLYALAMPITDGPHTTPELFDEGIPFVSAEAVSCGNGKINFNHIRGYISEDFYNECCLKYTPKINDIYMIKSGATTGRVSYVDTDIKFNIWSPLAVFRVNEKRTYFKYLFYYLQSDSYQKEVQLRWNYGTQQNIGMGTLETLKVLLPTINEQKEIADYLDQKCAEIDTLIAKKTTLLSELETYKKSLIYEYVTGKKEVGEDNVSTQVAVYSPYFPVIIKVNDLYNALKAFMFGILDKCNYDTGRVKLEKMMFVAQHSIGFDLGNEYSRAELGPLDSLFYQCEYDLVKDGCIIKDKKRNIRRIYYKPGRNNHKYKEEYNRYFADCDTEIERIINIFKDYDVQKSERIATLFGAWNDAIIDKRQFTDEDIVEDVLNNWHEHKGDYSKEEWLEDLEEMKKINLIPNGYGKKTVIKND